MPVPKICSLGLSKGLAGCTKAAGEEGGGRKGEIRGKGKNLQTQSSFQELTVLHFFATSWNGDEKATAG